MGPEAGFFSGSDAFWALFWVIAIGIPLSRIFSRAGFSWAWCLLCIVPFIGWFAAWLFLAMRDWPRRNA